MLVLHTIMWRRRWRRKRQNMWVHPINIKRAEFGIFSHLHRDQTDWLTDRQLSSDLDLDRFYLVHIAH